MSGGKQSDNLLSTAQDRLLHAQDTADDISNAGDLFFLADNGFAGGVPPDGLMRASRSSSCLIAIGDCRAIQ